MFAATFCIEAWQQKSTKSPEQKSSSHLLLFKNITHIFIHASIIIKYVFFYTTIVLNVNSQKIFKNLRKLPAAAPQLYFFTIVHTHHVRASFCYGHPHEILQRHFPNFFSENELSSAFPKKFYSMIKKLKTKKGDHIFQAKVLDLSLSNNMMLACC